MSEARDRQLRTAFYITAICGLLILFTIDRWGWGAGFFALLTYIGGTLHMHYYDGELPARYWEQDAQKGDEHE